MLLLSKIPLSSKVNFLFYVILIFSLKGLEILDQERRRMKTIEMEHLNGILFHNSEPANKQHTNHSSTCCTLSIQATWVCHQVFSKSYPFISNKPCHMSFPFPYLSHPHILYPPSSPTFSGMLEGHLSEETNVPSNSENRSHNKIILHYLLNK